MKIAFTSTYSWPSISGVWARIEILASELIRRGHEVHAFSSNLEAGTNKILKSYEIHNKIQIHRYPVKYKISKNASFWTCQKLKQDLLKIKPDIIDCQTYRHPESNFMLKLNKKLKSKLFLTTHAPFLEKQLRSPKLNFAVKIYDKFFSRLNKFKKIIAITRWEIPNLIKLGCKKENIVLIPNPLPEKFFKTKTKKGRNLLFLGRISEIKDLETLIKALKIVKQNSEYRNLKLKLVGPVEEPYGAKLIKLIRQLNLANSIEFFPPVLDINKKIKIFDEQEIFILPSKREGLPISLIEAMARAKIVISADNEGGKEIIKKEAQKQELRRQARKTAETYKLKRIIDQLERVYLS